MIFLKKYFQNQKGLQKLGTKHGPQAPREDFQKKSKFWIFSKKGGLGVQKMIFLKKYFQNCKGLQKLGTKHVPHAPKEEFQKNSKF